MAGIEIIFLGVQILLKLLNLVHSHVEVAVSQKPRNYIAGIPRSIALNSEVVWLS